MIDSIDKLESVDMRRLKMLCAKLDPDVLAIAMHGVSPALAKKLKRSMSLVKRIRVRLSPYGRTSVKLDVVEESHRQIVDSFNGLGS